MFKKALNLALSVAILMVAVSPAAALGVNKFSDVSATHPNSVAIYSLVEDGVITGYYDRTFKPGQLVNRAEMAAMIVRGLGVDTSSSTYSNCFSDVKTEWFAPYVCYGKKTDGRQWLAGYPGTNEFRPVNNINQVEALRMVLDAYEVDMITQFDLGREAVWYDTYLITARSNELIDIKGEKEPGELVTRGEVAELIYRTRNLVGDGVQVLGSGNSLEFVVHGEDYQGTDKLHVYRYDNNDLTKTTDITAEVDYRQDLYKSDKIQYYNGKIYAVNTVYKTGDQWGFEPPAEKFQILEIEPTTGKIRTVAELDDHHYILKWAPTKDGIFILHWYLQFEGEYPLGEIPKIERLTLVDYASGKQDVVVDKYDFAPGDTFSEFFELKSGVYSIFREDEDADKVYRMDYDVNSRKSSFVEATDYNEGPQINVNYMDLGFTCVADGDYYFSLEDTFGDPGQLDVAGMNVNNFENAGIYQSVGLGEYVRAFACNSDTVFFELASIYDQPRQAEILMYDPANPQNDPVKIAEGTLIDASDNYVVYERGDKLYVYDLSSNVEILLKVKEGVAYDNIYIRK